VYGLVNARQVPAPKKVPVYTAVPVDQWISGGRCSHGGAETRRKQRDSLKLPVLIVTGEGLCSILTHLGCP
jgi:hypothetical protein